MGYGPEAQTRQNNREYSPMNQKQQVPPRGMNKGNILQYQNYETSHNKNQSQNLNNAASWRSVGKDGASRSPVRNTPKSFAKEATPRRQHQEFEMDNKTITKSPSFYQNLKTNHKLDQENCGPYPLSTSPINNINSIRHQPSQANYIEQQPKFTQAPSQQHMHMNPRNLEHLTPSRVPNQAQSNQAFSQRPPVQTQAPAQNYTNESFFNRGGIHGGQKHRANRPVEVQGMNYDMYRDPREGRYAPDLNQISEHDQAFLARRGKNRTPTRRTGLFEMSPEQEPMRSPHRDGGFRSPGHNYPPSRFEQNDDFVKLDRYGRPIQGGAPHFEEKKPESQLYWAGRAPLRPPSPPRFDFIEAAPEPEVKPPVSPTPEKRYPNYIEVSPGVRSSPWRDDIQKKKAQEKRERELREEAERIKQQQDEIFFQKKKQRQDELNYTQAAISQLNNKSQSNLKSNSRYPNPEEMYGKFREVQEKNQALIKKHRKSDDSLWGKKTIEPQRDTRDRSPYRGGPPQERNPFVQHGDRRPYY